MGKDSPPFTMKSLDYILLLLREKRFQTKVRSLINVIKFSTITSTFTSNKVGPENKNEADVDEIAEDIDVLISSHLEHFM